MVSIDLCFFLLRVCVVCLATSCVLLFWSQPPPFPIPRRVAPIMGGRWKNRAMPMMTSLVSGALWFFMLRMSSSFLRLPFHLVIASNTEVSPSLGVSANLESWGSSASPPTSPSKSNKSNDGVEEEGSGCVESSDEEKSEFFSCVCALLYAYLLPPVCCYFSRSPPPSRSQEGWCREWVVGRTRPCP